MSDTPEPKPTRRNAVMTMLVPVLCFLAAPPLGNFLGTTSFRFAPTAAILAGAVILAYHTSTMSAELNASAGTKLVFWHGLIPIYGLYWAAAIVPPAMARAKRSAGRTAPRGTIVYLFLFLYAFASDLNDLADAPAA